jgi:hypothetical protein
MENASGKLLIANEPGWRICNYSYYF